MTRFVLTSLILSMALFGACSGDRTAAENHTPPTRQPAGPAAPADLPALLPAANEVQGWVLSRAPQSYTADNLWEAIDGGADSFLVYGVQQVVIGNYKQAGTGNEASVEIYRMKDPLNAYGKYSEERHPDYRFIDVGNEGYTGGTSVNFWKGAYYVKLTSFQPTATVEQEMIKLARTVTSKVSIGGSEPAELSYFPRQNQIPHTARYLAKDVLGQTYFPHGFEAHYKVGTNESRLVLIVFDSPAAAKDAMARYRQSVSKGEKNTRELTAPGEGGLPARTVSTATSPRRARDNTLSWRSERLTKRPPRSNLPRSSPTSSS